MDLDLEEVVVDLEPGEDLYLDDQDSSPEGELLSNPVEEERPDEVTVVDDISPEKPLNAEILKVLGDEDIDEKPKGDPIHQNICDKWQVIFKDGLKSEKRVSLIEKYPLMANTPFLKPPKLNPEVKMAVGDIVVKKDDRLLLLQHQLSAAISAVGKIINTQLEKEGGDNLQTIECANDAARLLIDLQHTYVESRRAIVGVNLNKDMKETLNSKPCDEWLFGGDLDNRIKNAKSMERSSLTLKTPSKPKAGQPSTSKGPLNWQGPPRLQSRAPRLGGPSNYRQHQAPPYRQQRSVTQGRGASINSRGRRPQRTNNVTTQYKRH